jgi:phosphoribosylformylglycinamidine cyclo-ligase
MFRVFNMGIGLTLVVAQEQVDRAIAMASELGDRAYCIGEIIPQQTEEGTVEYVE